MDGAEEPPVIESGVEEALMHRLDRPLSLDPLRK
jgi:hypothetical protein